MIHANSLLAEPIFSSKQKSYRAIDAAIRINGPLTDREILRLLYGPGENDLNKVRPRITEMKCMGWLKECGKKKDGVSGKTVRISRIKDPSEDRQPRLW